MSTIVVSPQQPDEEVTSEVIQLKIVVAEEDWLGFFNQIQVFRSRTGPDGPFDELTAATWLPARLPKTAGDPPSPAVVGPSANVTGTLINFSVGFQDTVVVSLAGPDPVTFASIASQIIAQGRGLVSAYVDSHGVLVAQSTAAGTGAALQVTGGDGASLVGLPLIEPDSIAYGRDPRIALVRELDTYLFNDLRGSRDYWYRTRFFNKESGAHSDFSSSFTSGDGLGVSAESVICGFVELVTVDGKPLTGREVRVHTNFNGTIVDGKLLAGSDIIKTTNASGRAEFTLLRGQRITAAIPGTTLFRTFTVPTDPTLSTFNLFDPTLVADDVFRVNVPDIIVAERRTL